MSHKTNNEMYHMVEDFHKAFGHHVSDRPTPIPEDVALNRATWTGEDLIEFLYATAEGNEDKFKELVGSFYAGLDKAMVKTIKKKPDVSNVLVAQMDALTDVEYFNQGSFVFAGVKPFNLFEIVQQANMGKLWGDGKPRYREEDGKIKKPPHWEENYAPEPKLKAEIERQIIEAK
jgi:predicted HAD superfamily Cof-like phosphohydrolase